MYVDIDVDVGFDSFHAFRWYTGPAPRAITGRHGNWYQQDAGQLDTAAVVRNAMCVLDAVKSAADELTYRV